MKNCVFFCVIECIEENFLDEYSLVNCFHSCIKKSWNEHENENLHDRLLWFKCWNPDKNQPKLDMTGFLSFEYFVLGMETLPSKLD